MSLKPKIEEKRWDKDLEPAIFRKWQEEKLYAFDKNSKKPMYSIDTPPPYVDAPVHIGQAYTYVWMDIMARSRRMMGFNVLFPLGLDKNGLPIEVQTEKHFKILMKETPRREFIRKCKELLKMYGDISLDTFKRLGLSCNSWEIEYKVGGRYETDDPEYRRLTQETFIKLWNRGLVYEDAKPTNYCPVCGTALSDAEIEYVEEDATLNYIIFNVKEDGEKILIATTRPELLCSCKVILFNPNDERYVHLKGKHAVVPIYGQEVRIIPHPYAKMDFGSGLVMICSFGDREDVRLIRELRIEPTYAIDLNGRMNENAGKYSGLTVNEARRGIIEDLKDMGLLVKQEVIRQKKPVCWRSKDPIEFVSLKEFYLKQLEFKDEMLKMADEMNFFAPESKRILIDWINTLSADWVISRRRYYGTEIPLWYCKKCGFTYVPEPGRYYQPWKEDPPIEKCPKCGGRDFIGEKRIFDTWFDSSTSEIYIMGYLWDKEFFNKHFPCYVRPQGKEIVRNWLYFTMLKSYLLFKKKPFRDVWINMHVLDERGRKMSKSLGNVIDPMDVIEKYGAEAFRMWSCLEGDITRKDIRVSLEKIRGASKFLTKLWNVSRFISAFPLCGKVELTATDKWILGELSNLIEAVKRGYLEYRFYDVAISIRDFVWDLFAPHYVEMVKPRAYGRGFSESEQKAAWFTLHTCLRVILKLLAPIIPFITDHLWLKIYDKTSIHKEFFPEAEWGTEFNKLTKKITDFNSLVWNRKKEKGLSLRESIKIKIPEELNPFAKDLVAMHRIENGNSL